MSRIEYRFPPFRLSPAARELWKDAALCAPTRPVFDCIAYLVEHRDRAVGRDELVAAVWGRVDVSDGHLNQTIVRARRMLDDDAQTQRVVRTVSGFGYRWIMPVIASDVEDVPAAPIAPESEPPPPAQATPAAVPRTSRIPRRIGWALLALALLIVTAGALHRFTAPRPVPAAAPVIAVLPVAVSAGPSEEWVRLGVMDLVAGRLREAALPVAPSEAVIAALHRMTDAAPDRAALARLLEAGTLVEGRAHRADGAWTVTLATVPADGLPQRAEGRAREVVEAARQASDRLLAALGRTPPGELPGDGALRERLAQAQAAVLAHALDTARTILQQLAPADAERPEVRQRLAEIDFRAGRLDAAEAALADLLALPEVQADPVQQARAIALRAKIHFRRGRFESAERDFDAALPALAAGPWPQELGDALATRGAARVALGRYEAASADLGQARLAMRQAADPLGAAQVEANFGVLEAQRDRPERALPYLAIAAERFEAFGAAERLLFVLTATYDAQAALLRWTDALATSDRLWALRDRIADPAFSLVVACRRGRVLLALGRYGEAEALFTETAARRETVRPEVLRYLHDFEADLAARRGRWADALAAADRALATWPAGPGHDRYAHLLRLRQQARIALGTAPLPREPAYDVAGTAEASPLLTLAAAEWNDHAHRPDPAAALYEAAWRRVDAAGTPAQIAWVAGAYVPWLLARGRLDEAAALAGRAAAWAGEDYGCAALQVAVFHARGQREAWAAALAAAHTLAGERTLPAAWTTWPPEDATVPAR
ncbi:winged helix-turn-helix domain-containing protein [Dokdonella koreensis]|uniref:Transcriptional regulator, CadC n=1 Tax=Dokdonella koreensis DS-123 TaxID=1300342 RepID=A0A160DXX4_9GAMM|nr:winged helix-turn-helix domain-containing protein [Dokdonella koreensis]ANB19605.1 Putative transcriptional regulator, CadC [Dokdonella koreensis DS-123]